MIKKPTLEEVALETFAYYNKYPKKRAVDSEGVCKYYDSKTRNKCAIGRCLRSPKRIEEDYGSIYDVEYKGPILNNLLKKYSH
jgi:hypothetical protein